MAINIPIISEDEKSFHDLSSTSQRSSRDVDVSGRELTGEDRRPHQARPD